MLDLAFVGDVKADGFTFLMSNSNGSKIISRRRLAMVTSIVAVDASPYGMPIAFSLCNVVWPSLPWPRHGASSEKQGSERRQCQGGRDKTFVHGFAVSFVIVIFISVPRPFSLGGSLA